MPNQYSLLPRGCVYVCKGQSQLHSFSFSYIESITTVCASTFYAHVCICECRDVYEAPRCSGSFICSGYNFAFCHLVLLPCQAITKREKNACRPNTRLLQKALVLPVDLNRTTLISSFVEALSIHEGRGIPALLCSVEWKRWKWRL